jgi:hypothetical protein
MVRAPAASQIGVIVPFGAAHRVNFDTPSLKGYCRGTSVPRWELPQSSNLIETGFLVRNLPFGATMAAQSITQENSIQRLRGRVARSRSIGTKLTPVEEQHILAVAEAQGKAPSEWVRDLLLRGAIAADRGEMEMHIFTELVGIQMLLMNTLEPLLRGEKMNQDQLTILFRQVQTTKAAKAQELLAKRSQKQEK